MRRRHCAPSPGRKCSASGGTPASSNLNGACRDERRLLGRLRDHRVAGRERRRDLSREDRERKIPRADADEHAAAAQLQLVALAGRARQAHARCANSARARRRSSAGNRRPRAPRRCCPGSCVPASRTQRATSSAHARSNRSAARSSTVGALARRRLVPVRLRTRRGVERAPRRGRRPHRSTVPMTSARFAGLRSLCRATLAQLARRRSRPRVPALATPRAPTPQRARRARRIGEIHAARIQSRSGRTARAAAGCADVPSAAARRTSVDGIGDDLVRWQSAHRTMRLTNDVLAPFSSRRRTRYGSRSSCVPTGA